MKFIDNRRKVKAKLERVSKKALTLAATLVENDAKGLAPIDTGGLINSISYAVKVSGKEAVAHVGASVHYAYYVEFGTGEHAEKGNGRQGGWFYQTPDKKWHFTKGSKPQPFLRPAFRENREEIKKIIRQVFREGFHG